MPRMRKVKIPEGLECNECGSTDLVGVGKEWKRNPHGDAPPRIKVQKLRCKNCGKIMLDGEVKN